MTDTMNSTYTRPTDEENLNETTNEKLTLMSRVPGLPVEFDPEEAELAGAFVEDALSAEEAEEAGMDGEPLE